jgi:hypothetical protein
MTSTGIRVVEVVHVRGVALAACDLLSGELVQGMKLKSVDGLVEWTVVGFSSVTPDLYATGRRGVSLSPSRQEAQLQIGEELFG